MNIQKIQEFPIKARMFTKAFEAFYTENCSDIRMDWDNYFLCLTSIISLRSTCRRRKYGALIVKNNKIVSSGYNGAPCGYPHCTETGECYREAHNIPHGQQYEKCIAAHSEQNAIISGNPTDIENATLYLVGFDVATGKFIKASPCEICFSMIVNAKILKIVTFDPDTSTIATNYVNKEVKEQATDFKNDRYSNKLFFY